MPDSALAKNVVSAAPAAHSAAGALLRALPRVIAGSLVVALAARLAVYLPGLPVPVSAQTVAVLLVGAALGARAGAASLALYWLQAAAGLPVCATGTGGPVTVFGPSGGFLVGFIAGAWCSGRALDSGWAATRTRQALALLGAAC
ncbi:MAG TPA: biotin transporter BioY, partial [Planctomycetota bacterium]|nr:biotin transporter BioY [Planctomycetota bacterium]